MSCSEMTFKVFRVINCVFTGKMILLFVITLAFKHWDLEAYRATGVQLL